MLIFRWDYVLTKWLTANKLNKFIDTLTKDNTGLNQTSIFLLFKVMFSEEGIYTILPNLWATFLIFSLTNLSCD